MSPLVRFTLPRAEIASSIEVELAAACFARDHAVRLPGLLAPDFLSYVQRQIEIDGFDVRVHDDLPSRPTDFVLRPSVAPAALMLAINDDSFLTFARALTGRGDIRSFRGTVARRVPGAGHDDAFHNDLVDGRVAVLTINLGSEPHEGGILQICEGDERRIVFSQANPVPGDAILFKLGPDLKHRVTAPEGRVARTVFSGWFRTEPAQEMFGLASAGMRERAGAS